jgi:hypothetical protein
VLTIACIQVERVLRFWSDELITLESIAEDRSGKGIRKAINGYTGKGTKTNDFNHSNWRGATNAYLSSIEANLANGKLVWKKVVSTAMEFAKVKVNDDSMTGAGDVEDERAFLVGDSDSSGSSDL